MRKTDHQTKALSNSGQETTALAGSGFEKKGGYASSKEPVASLPKVPPGPAPGSSASTGGNADASSK